MTPETTQADEETAKATNSLSEYLLREFALAVVPGSDEEDAFQNGEQGLGVPLQKCIQKSPLFSFLYAGAPSTIVDKEWVKSFFMEQSGWQHVDTSHLAERYYKFLTEDPKRHRSVLDLLVYATLPGEHEAPCNPEEYLQSRPEFRVPCTRALAILLMHELPEGVLGCIELLVSGSSRCFLFFGMRRVV